MRCNPRGGPSFRLDAIWRHPDRLRRTSIGTVVAILAIGAVAWLLTDQLVRQTDQVATSTGEVLIATQQISSSFAEADAAAVSVHLAAADGNRAQRRLYEQATERATASLEQVARLVGDDEGSHQALQAVAANTVEYAGLVEAARLASVEGVPGGVLLLTEAGNVNRTEIAPDVQLIADRARTSFNDQVSALWYLVAIVLLVLAAALTVVAHVKLSRQFRRLLNIPLALAAAILVLLVFVSASSFITQQTAFGDAEEEAFNAIQLSEKIQANAYRHRSLGTASVLAQAPSQRLANLGGELESTGDNLLAMARTEAGSDRELSVASEIQIRWDRYIVEADKVQQALVQGDIDEANELTQGRANATFNGFNAPVEAALLDNREQFLDQLGLASDSLRWLREYILIGTLLAALLTWWGFEQRIGEYR